MVILQIYDKVSLFVLPIFNKNILQIVMSRIFYTEVSMMTDTLDKMNKLIQPKYRLSGKAMYVQEDNPTLLVIEDLAPLGYRLACRYSGLDLDHCILALRGLARFHATSVAICEKVNHYELMRNTSLR